MKKYSHIGGLVDISLDEILSNLNYESFLKDLLIPENNYLLTFSGRSALFIGKYESTNRIDCTFLKTSGSSTSK